MDRIVEPLFLFLMAATRSDLARQIQFLRAENRILRERITGPIRLTVGERRRLVRLGLEVGPALRHLISIVRFETFRRWLKPPKVKAGLRRRTGRPPKPVEIRKLVVRLARNTGWGYSRILGELRKLGVRNIARATVRTILKQHGLEPAPVRNESTWAHFLSTNARTLWACDFFTTPVRTLFGTKLCYVLFFLHVQTRRVIVCPATFRPGAEWSQRQAEFFIEQATKHGLPCPEILIRDGDAKFGTPFNAALRRGGCMPKRLPPGSPLLNAFAERWVRSVKRECLLRPP